MNTLQAVQIKYLAPTNTLCSRLKISAYSGTYIKTLSNDKDVSEQAYEAALEFAKSFGWVFEGVGFGVLPNGDYVMTFKG